MLTISSDSADDEDETLLRKLQPLLCKRSYNNTHTTVLATIGHLAPLSLQQTTSEQ